MVENHYNITAYKYKILYFDYATRGRPTIHDLALRYYNIYIFFKIEHAYLPIEV